MTSTSPRVLHLCARLGAVGVAALAACAPCAHGQATSRAVFVANNGNLEGSVSSFTIDEHGVPTLVDKFITGTRPSGPTFHPGTNAQSISLTPNGAYLAIGHGTQSQTFEQLTILAVQPDASLELFGIFQVADSPIDLEWLSDNHLAVTQTNSGSILNVHQFDFDAATRILIDFEPTGSFSTSLAVHPSRGFIYAQDSTNRVIRAFRVEPDHTLTLVEVQSAGAPFPLGLGISPNGSWLYAGGGISDGGRRVLGFGISPVDGSLDILPGAHYTSPGSSPKQVVVSSDNLFAFAAHGTDSTIRGFNIDQATGALTSNGVTFDVGFQGSLGEIGVLDDLLLVIDRDTIDDGVRGLYSFTIKSDGALEQNGPLTDTTGISPWTLAAWKPPVVVACPDIDGDGAVGSIDLAILLGSWGPCPMPTCPADLDGDGAVDAGDLALLCGGWGACD